MDKAKAKRDFKETRRPMGVYRIMNKQDGTSYIGASTDLVAIINRQKAELKFGTHRHAELLDAWRTFGESRFAFEILDELSHNDDGKENPREELQTLLEMWKSKLQATGDRVVDI